METIGLGFYFEDLPVGRQFKTIGRTITDADITNFINATRMVESMFTDLEFMKTEIDIKGLVYTFAEGLLVQSTMQHTGFAFLNMELDIKAPTFSGDTIHVECEVVEARLTSRPGRGLVRTKNHIINQYDVTVITYTPLRMIKCKNPSITKND